MQYANWRLPALCFVFLFIPLQRPVPTQADQRATALEQWFSPQTRLIVFSPHPDDETLGAGGMIQRVLRGGGKVKVVYVTSGDGYTDGISTEEHILHPSAQDFRFYGARREKEASLALATLGATKQAIAFLGFPDRGLCPLLRKYWVDHPPYYVSPYTQEDRPPSFDEPLPRTEYDGEDLTNEIGQILAKFRPTLIAVTSPQDRHPDHCATYFFVKRALQRLEKKEASWRPVVLTFLIHFGQWPDENHADSRSPLSPPESFPAARTAWIQLPLSPQERETKRQALLQYHSQMTVMGSYLMSFVRANELFLPDLSAENVLVQQACCGQ